MSSTGARAPRTAVSELATIGAHRGKLAPVLRGKDDALTVGIILAVAVSVAVGWLTYYNRDEFTFLCRPPMVCVPRPRVRRTSLRR
jgi:hypothetical protein